MGFSPSNCLSVALVGYSGRDDSVMDALEQGVELHGQRAYPGGLFWCHRAGGKPAERVQRLIEDALATLRQTAGAYDRGLDARQAGAQLRAIRKPLVPACFHAMGD